MSWVSLGLGRRQELPGERAAPVRSGGRMPIIERAFLPPAPGLGRPRSPAPKERPRALRRGASMRLMRRLRRSSQSVYLACVFAACSASVSHRSAISMKRDLCCEVRAASANRMHSAALLRNRSKLGKSASISVHMGTDRPFCLKCRRCPRERPAGQNHSSGFQ